MDFIDYDIREHIAFTVYPYLVFGKKIEDSAEIFFYFDGSAFILRSYNIHVKVCHTQGATIYHSYVYCKIFNRGRIFVPVRAYVGGICNGDRSCDVISEKKKNIYPGFYLGFNCRIFPDSAGGSLSQ
jgi:hypothetical protein